MVGVSASISKEQAHTSGGAGLEAQSLRKGCAHRARASLFFFGFVFPTLLDSEAGAAVKSFSPRCRHSRT